MAAILGTLTFLLYLGTLSGHYSADSVLFALQIEGDQLEKILDPTHLLLEPLGYGWYRLWRAGGWSGASMMPLQVMNAVAGASSVVLLYAITKTLTRQRRAASLVSMGFAVSGGLWLLSVEAEFATVPLAVSLLVLWLIIASPPSIESWRGYGPLLGAVVSLAILTYLSSAILIAVGLLGLLSQADRSRHQRRNQAFGFIITVALICLPVAAALLSHRSLFEWADSIWQNGGRGYTTIVPFDLLHGLYAFLRTLGLYPGLALNDSSRAFLNEADIVRRMVFAVYYGVLLVAALTPLLLAIRLRKHLWTRYRRESLILLFWSVAYMLFAIYWVPGDITFWLPVLAAWWILVAMVMTMFAETRAYLGWTAGLHPGRIAVHNLALAAFVTVLLVLNATLLILPRRHLSTNDAYRLADQVRRQTSTADLIVSSSDDVVSLYLVYFGRRTVLPVADDGTRQQELTDRFVTIFQEVRSKGGDTYWLKGEELVLLLP